jgi:hypothetical protein
MHPSGVIGIRFFSAAIIQYLHRMKMEEKKVQNWNRIYWRASKDEALSE